MPLQKDTDISNIPASLKAQVVQRLFVCTGCDYTFLFVGIGKSRFLSAFFQHASFIGVYWINFPES